MSSSEMRLPPLVLLLAALSRLLGPCLSVPPRISCYSEATDTAGSNATLVACQAGFDACLLHFRIDKLGGYSAGTRGCWHSNSGDCGISDCLFTPGKHEDHGACCCLMDRCNAMSNIRLAPTSAPPTPPSTSPPDVGALSATSSPRTARPSLISVLTIGSDQAVSVVLFSLIPVLVICVAVVLGFFLITWHRDRRKARRAAGGSESPPSGGQAALAASAILAQFGHLSSRIALQEKLATGKFGSVHAGTDQETGQRVAVKVFPPQERNSWLVEQELYNLPEMRHPNILRFIGADQHCLGSILSLWLVTEYHLHGSAHDYLAGHTVTWPQLVDLVESLSRGLAFLHEGFGEKPAVAHRDIKSRNVLIRDNLTCCIADLGLAKKFCPGEAIGDVHPQVGTRRYMSPEVLEGAMSFYKDSFLRVDVYSLGLVLWEMLTRCTDAYGDEGVPPYRLPFEAETGSPNPSLLQMQAVVVHERRRPEFPLGCQTHQGLSYLRETIDCCWDHVPEARLTAACVAERCKAFRLVVDSRHLQLPSPLRVRAHAAAAAAAPEVEAELRPLRPPHAERRPSLVSVSAEDAELLLREAEDTV